MKIVLANKDSNHTKEESKKFITFYVDGKLYGIDVMKVQEITRPMKVTNMRTAPVFIQGLINLRGQIATAVGLREFLGFPKTESEKMTIVCRIDDVLLSFLVDEIGEVVEVTDKSYEPSPMTLPANIRAIMEGVYKTNKGILSILNLENILGEIDKKCA